MLIVDTVTFLFASFIISYVVVNLVKKYFEFKKLPPGPWGLPLVGYTPFLTLNPHLKITQLAKKYGNVFSVKLGNSYVVFLNDWKSIKDAFSKDAFNGRPRELFTQTLSDKNDGLAFFNEGGYFWREQRRFSFRVFRDLGLGKETMETNIKDEISYLMKEIDKGNGNPVSFHNLIIPSVSNNICYFIFGHRLDYNDPKRKLLDFVIQNSNRLFQVTNMVAFFGLLVKMMRLIGGSRMQSFLKKLEELEQLFDEEIEQHEKKRDNNNEITDYIDAFLQEKNKENCVKEVFTRNVVNATSQAFFGAGSETVRITLEWLFRLIAEHQDIQEAIQKELNDVVGNNRLPSYADRELMPLTEAVIWETLRWSSVIPLNLPRRTREDTTVLGHFIPGETVVIANFWAVNRDPDLYNNPEQFDPYRFINEKNEFQKPDYLIPFSIGKRSCIGETLARFELFLYFTIIMQNYKVTVPKGVKQSFDSVLGISLQPSHKTDLMFEKRIR